MDATAGAHSGASRRFVRTSGQDAAMTFPAGPRRMPSVSNTLTLSQARRLALTASGLPGREPVVRSIADTCELCCGTPRCCRSTASRRWCGRTTCRCGPGSVRTTEVCSTACTASCSSTGRTRRACCRSRCTPCCGGGWRRPASSRGRTARLPRLAREQPAFMASVLQRVRDQGPLAASDLGKRGEGSWWGWSPSRNAPSSGSFGAVRWPLPTRRSSFERVYDLPERVLPHSILELPTTASPPPAQRELILHRRSVPSRWRPPRIWWITSGCRAADTAARGSPSWSRRATCRR